MMRIFFSSLLILTVSLFALSSNRFSPSVATAAEKTLRTTESRTVDIEHIKLDVTVSLEQKALGGTATISFRPFQKIDLLSLDAVGFDVSSVRLLTPEAETAQKIRHDSTEKELTAFFPKPLKQNGDYQLEVDYRVQNPAAGLHFSAPAEADTTSIAWTQGEPQTNRHWFPCFDHPNERQSTELIVTVDSGLTVLSNGKLVSKNEIEETKKTQFHWKQESTHVSYLVTLVVGEFELVEEEWNSIPVQYYVPPAQAEDVARTFGRTKAMLEFFSEKFGINYPWDKYAQVVLYNFISGGMENTSATSLHDGTMIDERAVIDTSVDWLIAHELGHQWWGDLVTCKDWSHIWLNEGFASYCEILWSEHHEGAEERDYHLYSESFRARSNKALTHPLVDRYYADPTEMFDARAYPKGSWVLHMLRRHVGDKDFFRCINRYGIEYSFSTAETSDLRKVFERLLGLSLERFFYDWTERPGHPELLVTSKYDTKSQKLRVNIKQTQKWEPFHFPLKIEVWGEEKASKVVLDEFITEKEATFFVDLPQSPRLVRVDPEYSLLAKIEESKSEQLWQNQLTLAPSIVERIRAAQHLSQSATPTNLKKLATALEKDSFYGVQREIARALGKSKMIGARDILLKALKHPHPKVRRSIVAALQNFENDAAVAEALKQKLEAGDESYYVESAAIRALAIVQQDAPLYKTIELLDKESHRQTIRQAALESLGYCHDPRALDTLLQWTRPDKYHACRRAAMNGIVKYIEQNNLPLKRQKQLVNQLAKYLASESPLTRRSTVTALGSIGEASRELLSRIQYMSHNDPHGWTRQAAVAAAKKIETANLSRTELKTLRSEVEKLRKQNEELNKRIDNFETP